MPEAAPHPDEHRARIGRIEALIHRDTGRNVAPLFAASRGGLFSAASALTSHPAPRVGLLTGFYVPLAEPPAAETDGPAGAALIAAGLIRAGLTCRLLTDTLCHRACAAALSGAGLRDVPIDTVEPGAATADATAVWRKAGIDVGIAIERCGRSAGGPPRNMRGVDVSTCTAALDDVFLAGTWDTIAIGDGGNEVGMGALPRGLISRTVPNGELIACITPAKHLIVAGVSHWGAYALLAAVSLLRPDWRSAMLSALDPSLDARVLSTLVEHGPAVDGVLQRVSPTIDTLPLPAHHAMLRAIRAEAAV